MFKSEKKLLDHASRNAHLLLCASIFIISLMIVYCLRDIISGDMEVHLLQWYDVAKTDGMRALLDSSDYNVPYLFLIKFMTYLPIRPLFSIKLISIAALYVGAVYMAKIVHLAVADDKKKLLSSLAFSLGCLSPIVLLNSAAWGQCDSLYTTFTLIAIYKLMKDKVSLAFIFLGISIAFKLQAAFVLPLFVFIYAASKRFSIVYFIIIPLVIILSGVPAIFWGHSPLYALEIYVNQVGGTPYLSWYYPNVYLLFNNDLISEFITPLAVVSVLFTLSLLIVILFIIMNHCINIQMDLYVLLGAFSILLCAFFLPKMHERYAFAGEVLLLLSCTIKPTKKRLLSTLLIHISILSFYLRYVFHFEIFQQSTAVMLNASGLLLLCIDIYYMLGSSCKNDVSTNINVIPPSHHTFEETARR